VPRADESAHRSPREGRGLLDAGCDRLCCSTAQVTAVLSRAQSCTDSSAATALVASKSVIFVTHTGGSIMALELFVVSARTNKRHHHHASIIAKGALADE